MEPKVVSDGVKENPFKLFIPPRVSCGPISAVRPQEVTEDSFFMQNSNGCHHDDLGVPFLMTSTPKLSKTGNQDFIDPILLKPQKMLCMEKENTEHISQLYTKLFHEAERIKKWKLAMDNDLWQKDKKLQENKQTIEVQRKAIQEQQFENESLSMKLEEEISKNEEATKIHNATRDLCSLVKETCSRSTEKMRAYEAERDETRRLYAENAENIERIIMAFEELRKQAENSRLEIIFKLKEEMEQREQLRNKYQQQLNEKENEVQHLQQQYKQKDSELHETWIHLQESKLRCDQLEETIRHLNENLQDACTKEQSLTTELKKTEDLLKKREVSQKSFEEELENAMKIIIQLTGEKESQIEEFNKVTTNSASTIAELRNTIEHLEESVRSEQRRSKQIEETLRVSSLELEEKTSALVKLEQSKIENELKINQLKEALNDKTITQDKLEEELMSEKLEKGKYFEQLESAKKIQNDLQDKEVILLHKIEELQKSVDELMKENANLKEATQSKESVLSEMQGQIINSLSKERDCFEKINSLKAGITEERKKHEKLFSDYNILLTENETISHNLNNRNAEIKDLQRKLEIIEQKEESAQEEIEKLKKQNNQQKEELKALEQTLKQQDQIADTKLEEKEENSKHLLNEVKKKEKLMKTMENKLNCMKKQLENKNKSNEELNQENKSLKKKLIEGTKHCNVYRTEIEQLNLQLTSLNKQSEETIQSLEKAVEKEKLDNEKLNGEVKTLKLTAEAAVLTQKEAEMMCQNKIAEMVTLMEKHKHQYDKMVDEKDAELKCWKEKELNVNLCKKPLEIELLSVKDELSGIKKELKNVIEEKGTLAKQAKALKDTVKSLNDELKKKVESNSILKMFDNTASNCEVPSTPVKKNNLSTASKSAELSKQSGSIIQRTHTWASAEKSRIVPNHQTYTIRTPPVIQNKLLIGTMKPPCGEVLQKKRKVALDLDTHSDSSEHSDLLSMIPESEMFRELYKGNSDAACFFEKPQQQLTSPAKPKIYGNALKLATVKKMRAAGWEAVAKESRKKRMKIAEKIF